MPPLVPPLVFAAGCALVAGTHPQGFGGWGLWALSPLAGYAVYLLVFRTPPQRLRVATATVAAGGYAALFGLVAGLGNESYTEIARIVYLGLPALGLLGLLGCVAAVELAGAIATIRARKSWAAGGATPARPLLATVGLVAGSWSAVSLAGWTGPQTVVAAESATPPPPVAEVRCAGRTTYLLTPTVAAREDGIRVRVDNRGSSDAWIEYEIDGGSGGGGGEQVPHGVSERLLRFSASSVGIACVEHSNAPRRFATFAIVAPNR